MKPRMILLCAAMSLSLAGVAQRVTLTVVDRPAAEVFRSIMAQTDKNFVYPSQLLDGVRVSVDVRNKPLKAVLKDMFGDTDVEFRIKGNDVILKRRATPRPVRKAEPVREVVYVAGIDADAEPEMLEEVVVVSRLEAPAVSTSEIGAAKFTSGDVLSTPALFGESDVIRTLHTQPGVSAGAEGMAGMYVHGGNADENLCMLDNVPLYQVNHFAGLFSAFNPEVIRYIDFFKSSVPAKYDGRLSSFMDVRTISGSEDGHHGSAKLGLTSGAFNISGPIGSRTTYMGAVRRSWYDVLTLPIVALVNSLDEYEKIRLNYYFMDVNAKISHRFSDRVNAFASVYFGDDMLLSGSSDKENLDYGWYDEEKFNFHWGNLVAQGGVNYRASEWLTAEFTAAYTRFFSAMKHREYGEERNVGSNNVTSSSTRTNNNITDWIFRGDFDWRPAAHSHVRFGGGYTRHTFLPTRTDRNYAYNDDIFQTRDTVSAYHANEVNVYVEDDWTISGNVRANIGLHASVFGIDGRVRHGLSPRVSVSWRATDAWAVKCAYSRTVQYVHQLTQSYMALPTDQWIPITGDFEPESADKVSAAVYWQSDDGGWEASAEGYYKYMHNLVDYRDEYYLHPPLEMWKARLTTGRGTAKGVDLKLERTAGRVTGHISYSLAWADRTFADKNGGRTYPARFDNRHTLNLLVNWRINDRVQVNASWTGHSGDRFTLLPQVWQTPGFGQIYNDSAPLRAAVNNYQLPFYHRLDLGCTVRNSRGYWSFGIYNAYCHLNTIAVQRGYDKAGKPVFQKVKFLPLIPSISYTWQF